MLPKMIPFSVDETLTLALILQKSCGAKTTGCGRSTSFKSPTVASSSVQFCNVSPETKFLFIALVRFCVLWTYSFG